MKVLLKAVGTDASKQFDAFHNASVLTKVASKYLIGEIGTGDEEQAEEEEEMANDNPLIVGDAYGDMVPFGDPMWYQDWYSPYYNETHRQARKAMREFVDNEIMPFCHEWDEAKALPKELYVKAAKAGILAACVGEVEPEYIPYGMPGGVKVEEFDAFHSIIAADELSRCGSGGVSNCSSVSRL